MVISSDQGLAVADNNEVLLQARVDKDFRQRLKVLAAVMDISIGDLLTRLVVGGDKLEDLERKHIGGTYRND